MIFFGLLASYPLFGKGYFNMHDDLQMMRQLEMEKCFKDGQIPCRWVSDMGYGFGFPLFNFYPPLPYLIGQGIRLMGFDFVSTAKGLFILAFITSGVTMYFLAKDFFGRFGGVVSAVFYIWAPYHSVDIYVRGAMNESWALVWFPLILWSAYRLIKEKADINVKNQIVKNFKWLIALSLTWFALFTSHNLMVLIFAPVFAVWCIIWLIKFKNWQTIPSLVVSGVLAFGLTAFFTLPAVVENKFTHIESVLVGYYDYTGHFATINQLLFSRFWGYGPSVWLEADGMSFQVGHIHWLLSLIVFAIVSLRVWKQKKLDSISLSVIFLFVVGWLATFLAHSKSTPIWLLVSPFRYLQFPWRFLTLPTFAFSFLSGFIVWNLPKDLASKYKTMATTAAIVLIVSFNWYYFKPEHGKLGPVTDEEKLSGAAWDLQQTAGIYDYLPIWAKTAPKAPQKYSAEVARGKVEVTEAFQKTNWVKFKAKVEDDRGWVRVNTFYFPGWIAFDNGKEVKPYVPDEEKWGRMWIELAKGEHDVSVKFVNTPIRTIGNTISLISWLTLLTSTLWLKKVKLSSK